MRKALICFLVVVMVLSLTACSQELASLMGSMSNNVYGIEADTSDATAAAETVSSSTTITTNAETGKAEATVDLTTAASITSSISEIKNSPTKTAALKSQLSETVVPENATAEEKQAVKDAIVSAAASAATTIAEVIGDKNNEVVAEIQETLNNIESSISENPTKAELATVAVLAEVATTVADVVKSGAEELTEEQVTALVDKGLAAYDTLIVVTEVAKIDIFKDINVESLIESVTSKDVSRADEKEEEGFDFSVARKTVEIVLDMITVDKTFNEAKYNSFLLQAKALKASIDTIAYAYYKVNPDDILNSEIDCGLTIDDLGRYAVASAFVEADKLGGEAWTNLLEAFLNANYDAILALSKNAKFTDVDQGLVYAAMVAFDTRIDGSLNATTTDAIFEELANDMKHAIATKTASMFTADAYSLMRTVAVLLVDSEYTGLIELASGKKTITGLLSLLDK